MEKQAKVGLREKQRESIGSRRNKLLGIMRSFDPEAKQQETTTNVPSYAIMEAERYALKNGGPNVATMALLLEKQLTIR